MSSFNFHASATGVGGVLTRGGGRTTVPTLASINLATAGGEGDAFTGRYDQHGVSFDSIASHVFGLEVGDGIFFTLATVKIMNFAAYDESKVPVLEIESMEAQMQSTRDLRQTDSRFTVTLSYSGITVNGVLQEPLLDVALCNAATFGEFSDMLNSDPAKYEQTWGFPKDRIKNALAAPRPVPIDGTLVQGFRPSTTAELSSVGCELKIPGYGLARFAEFKFQPGRRNVSLLRLTPQSGSVARPDGAAAGEADSFGGGGGDLTLGAVEGNGSPPF